MYVTAYVLMTTMSQRWKIQQGMQLYQTTRILYLIKQLKEYSSTPVVCARPVGVASPSDQTTENISPKAARVVAFVKFNN